MVNVTPKKCGKNERMSFGKINEVLEMPNLIEIQKNSFKWFREEGLNEVFEEASDITDYSGKYSLRFHDPVIEAEPNYSIPECKDRDATYSAKLRVIARLRNNETGDVKEKEINMGLFPLMTPSGTFVINGAERVIVSQLVRSPGVYYDSTKDRTGKDLFSSTVIPNRGAWLEYEMDSNDVVYVRIDKNRKIAVTTFIRALYALEAQGENINPAETGLDEEILRRFNCDERLKQTIEQKDTTHNGEEALIDVYKKLRPGEPPTVESSVQHLTNLFFDPRRYDMCRFGRYKYNKKLGIASRLAGHQLSRDIIDENTGEVLFEAGATLSYDQAYQVQQAGVMTAYVTVETKEYFVTENGENEIRFVEKEVQITGNGMVDIKNYVSFDCEPLGIHEDVCASVLQELLQQYGADESALKTEIHRHADDLVPKHITMDDIYATISYFLNLCDGVGTTDDIDHLGNRRIRSVGELLQNQFRIGYTRMERVIREKMNLQSQDSSDFGPQNLINIRPVTSAIREFFGSSPLSQFMDQNNPLAELTHKRRLSALGPGGLSRDRAGFEVRDVHYTHYGRMCPIETPEGPNIGLISYLASFARINKYGFIEAPYRRVDKATGVVTDEVVYMTADVEDNYVVAQANEPLTEDGKFANEKVAYRSRNDIGEIERERVDFMDVSPKMVVSVATSMIPFLENDDANRALMGANMQRQAVPLLKTERPFVGTGMEHKAAVDSGVCVVAEEDGIAEFVAADIVKVRDTEGRLHEYPLQKYKRSNQGTCINQRPIVSTGEVIKKGDVLADGPATAEGEISLGKNALIGFMTWEGYNYEDAVLLNERLVREDVFTSVHIEEYEIECRDTKLGPEEITRDIPNVGDDALKDLDEYGIIRVGAEVHSGDILVGKVTPKGETELTAEERLLRAIFGEKAREVRDNSLKVPHGAGGIVVDVKIFARDLEEGMPAETKTSDELSPGVNMLVRCYIAQKRKISVGDKMAGRHGNKGVVSRILPEEDMPFLPDGTPLDIVLNPLGVPSRMNIGQVLEVHLGMASKALGWHIMTPVFDGAHEADIREAFNQANEQNKDHRDDYFDLRPMGKVINPKALEMCEDGKFTLYDGRTGEKFDNRVTVGYMYYLKLHHLVDDKIHARSVGPYALVTQQPLGGKAQFGGQRFGEMEVWALEAYGAAYTLQEILTVKSDDTVGRVNTYEAIVKGQNVPKPGIPESFKVLIKEMQSLGLDVRALDSEGVEVDLRTNYDEEDAGRPQVVDDPSELDNLLPYEQNSSYDGNDQDLESRGFTINETDEKGHIIDSELTFEDDTLGGSDLFGTEIDDEDDYLGE